MGWLRIRSRLGNSVLLLLGAAFAAASLALLAYYLVDSWGYASMVDRALQFILGGVAVFGLALALGARDNIKGRMA